jgi:hypothetical protein
MPYYKSFKIHNIIMEMANVILVEVIVRNIGYVPPSEYVERITRLHLLAASQADLQVTSLVSVVCDLRSDDIENILLQAIFKRSPR